MLARLLPSAKKAVRLLEQSLSPPNHSLKQIKETPGYVRSYCKVEPTPGAKGNPAAMPNQPSPSTGASISAAAASSSSSSWKSHPSKAVWLLGAGALGTGALLYSLSSNAEGGDDRKKRSKGEADMPFFNRETEQTQFKKMLNGRPGVITVLVGPPSCGKTRFLKELAGQLEQGQNPPPVIFINSRQVQVNGPEAISKALCVAITSENILSNLGKFPDLVQTILEKVSVAVGVKTPVGNVSVNLAKLAEFIKKDEENLNQTIEKLTVVFTAMGSLPRKPVIIIDEANNLMDWEEPDSSHRKLKQILEFLVSISKEANLVHVILATSDYFLVNWLSRKGMAKGNFVVEVLGDLNEEEAKVFFLGDKKTGDGDKKMWSGIINDPSEPEPLPVEPKKTWSEVAEENWPVIYERCGGNIGLLMLCVKEARAKECWNEALKIVVANSRKIMEDAFTPTTERDEPPQWTEKEWKTVLERITTAKHHAVLRDDLAKELEKGDVKKGKRIILSMVKHNMLAMRPYSSLARDLAPEAHGPAGKEVVTLPSPGHVKNAKEVLLEKK